MLENLNYLLKVTNNGICLYKKINDEDQLSTQLASIDLAQLEAHSSSINTGQRIKLLERFTLVGSRYELVFSIVDAIVNRSLQRNFSFENDQYALHLRIAFALLVPTLNYNPSLKYGYKYDANNLTNKSTLELDIAGFMAIKRFLDEGSNSILDLARSSTTKPDKKVQKLQRKMAFLNLAEITDFDRDLKNTLEQYHSDDSDSEAEYPEREIDPSNVPKFHHSIKSYSASKHAKINADLNKLNHFLTTRDPQQEKLIFSDNGKIKIGNEELETEFVIAGFRGINHMPLRFSDDARRLYRQPDFQIQRSIIPYYSEAVLMSCFDFYRSSEGIRQHLLVEKNNENRERLDVNAENLEAWLLETRDTDYILVHGLSGETRLFSNFLYFLQHIYSNGIIKSQHFLREHLLNHEIFLPLPSAYNPFVSESEMPDHAFRYSFGQKSLYEFAALHPHYDSKGKPSFPYIGEINLSIRGSNVFTSKYERHQLRKLEKMYRVNPTFVIGTEVESTGFGWLPDGEVVFSEAVKCPSFSGHWKNSYRDKYGLTMKLFNAFKNRFSRSREYINRLQIERDVIEHLIEHYSTRLLKKAFQYAKDKVLVFLDSDGNLTFDLPIREMERVQDEGAKQVRLVFEQNLKGLLNRTISPQMQVKLNSETMKIYSIHPTLIEELIRNLKIQDPDNSALYEKYRLDEERLRVSPDKLSAQRTPNSTVSRGSVSPYTYTGSPGTPLSDRPYPIFSVIAGEQEEPLTFEEIHQSYRNCLAKQSRLLKLLELKISDYEILTKFSDKGKIEQELYQVTLEVFHYYQLMSRFNSPILNSKEGHTDLHQWIVTLVQHYVFDEEKIVGDGWCLLTAIGINDPEKAIDDLISKVQKNELDSEAKNYLLKAITNNFYARSLGEAFLTNQIDDEGEVILKILESIQQQIDSTNTNTSEHNAAYASLISYLGRSDVLKSYLIYIKDTKYVEENIGAALLHLLGERLVSLINNNGELFVNSDQLETDVIASNVRFVIFHPNTNPRLSHYNKLTYNKNKSILINAQNPDEDALIYPSMDRQKPILYYKGAKKIQEKENLTEISRKPEKIPEDKIRKGDFEEEELVAKFLVASGLESDLEKLRKEQQEEVAKVKTVQKERKEQEEIEKTTHGNTSTSGKETAQKFGY